VQTQVKVKKNLDRKKYIAARISDPTTARGVLTGAKTTSRARASPNVLQCIAHPRDVEHLHCDIARITQTVLQERGHDSSSFPPFHHRWRGQRHTQTLRLQWPGMRGTVLQRGGQATEDARWPGMHGPRQGCHSKCAARLEKPPRRCGLGFSETRREPPENEWVAQGRSWGCRRRVAGQEALTVSALSFPQFTQMHSSIFFTLTRKPVNRFEHRQNCNPRGRNMDKPI
jgi:hypothetical protein